MQEAIVALIVVCASWMVARRYVPKQVKRNVRVRLANACRALGWESAARRLERVQETSASCADGCGSCGGCGTKGSAVPDNEFAITRDSLKRPSHK